MFHIVVNPAGGSGKTRKIWQRIEPVFKKSGRKYVVHYSTKEHGIEEICQNLEEKLSSQKSPKKPDGKVASETPATGLSADKPGENETGETLPSGIECSKDALIIVGGDGSVNEAINGLKNPASFLFGHIPTGSGNDLIKDMQLPRRPEDLARRILEGEIRRRSDVGEVKYPDTGETRRFLISSGIGFDAAICEMSLRSRYKDALNRFGMGGLIYLMSAFRLINSQTAGKADIILDGDRSVHYGRLLLLACMNHCCEGGGFKFAPDADFQDGVLNLCTADPKSNLYFYLAFPFARFGRHLSLRYIHALTGHTIEVTTEQPMWVHTDGEVKRKADHILISILPEQMLLLE